MVWLEIMFSFFSFFFYCFLINSNFHRAVVVSWWYKENHRSCIHYLGRWPRSKCWESL